MQKSNNRDGHVVASNASRLAVRSQAVVHHVLADGREFLLGSNTAADKLHHGLRRLTIPDAYASHVRIGVLEVRSGAVLTIACQYNELVILSLVVNSDVREGSDNLLLRR